MHLHLRLLFSHRQFPHSSLLLLPSRPFRHHNYTFLLPCYRHSLLLQTLRNSCLPLTYTPRHKHTLLAEAEAHNNNMTTEPVASPPNSPPSKRVKTGNDNSITSTMAESNNTTSVPLLEQSPPFLVKKLSDKARLPTRGSAFSAGYDLYSSQVTTVPARGQALVDTDISMALPAGTYGRVAPRSGLAVKNSIQTGAGVIDADYRGQVKILLFNHSDKDFAIAEGDRVAQLVIERIYTPDVVEVAELEESVRGAGGFGSTGTN